MVCSMGHTFSPTCMLHQASNEFTRRASVASTDPPPISVQYFYSSTLPIDDPLSPVPPVSSNPAINAKKLPPRPFSVHDNIALEDGWLKFQKRVRSKNNALGAKHDDTDASSNIQKHILQVMKSYEEKHMRGTGQTNSRGFEALEPMPETRSDMISKAVANAPPPVGLGKEHRLLSPDLTLQDEPRFIPSGLGKEQRDEDALEPMLETKSDMTSKAVGNTPDPVGLGKEHRPSSPDLTLSDEPKYIPFDDTMPVTSEEIGNDEFESGIVKKKRSWSPFRHKERAEKPNERDDTVQPALSSPVMQKAGDVNLSSSLPGRDTSGTPFLRITSRLRRSRSRSPESIQSVPALGQADGTQSPQNYYPKTSSPLRPALHRSPSSYSGEDEEAGPTVGTSSRRHSLRPDAPISQAQKETAVAVGMLRLHVVRMPSLKMWPIYWDPIHDISSVIRGTWFFKDSMMPIECDLANRIEEGYEYIRPWTLEYVEELNSCMEVGPEAELKIIYKLGQDLLPADMTRPTTGKSSRSLLGTTAGEVGAQDTRLQEAVVAAKLAENKSAGVLGGFTSPHKELADAGVIYANGRDAQILRPSQFPSVSRGRKPLASIRKGKVVGIPIVRGFDMKTWQKLHPPPSHEAAAVIHARKMAHEIKKASTIDPVQQLPCIACESADERPKPTDLVLVIHGIGQKLSERVESFHFTHNINRFRRSMNMELQDASVRPWLRQDLGTVMVLPVNWRSKMNLDAISPGPKSNRTEMGSVKNHFALKDITAESLPAVRNLISDVMLDIPYYLSHHRPKMIEAVIHEANRIYQLWCNNNPGFQENGRVHLIAHSLGSVMCLDILSNQPTKLPKPLDLKTDRVRGDIFEFDTKNLFFCGSPAGFFLLLNKAPLVPRKGREKPDAEGEDNNSGVAGEAGTYGCLAVDNLYNVMHYLDPVAYRLNACVDVDYAAALKPAFVPNALATWTQYFGGFFRGKPAVPPARIATSLDAMPRRPTVTNMPSTVELETHDFTREEIAEKRMFLLNDNGQIDYTLHSSGGALGFQYLNMLSAHSSYWSMKDFVRFLVVEIGRKPGKSETLNAMKAAKKAHGTK